jgi:hypothetical protein
MAGVDKNSCATRNDESTAGPSLLDECPTLKGGFQDGYGTKTGGTRFDRAQKATPIPKTHQRLLLIEQVVHHPCAAWWRGQWVVREAPLLLRTCLLGCRSLLLNTHTRGTGSVLDRTTPTGGSQEAQGRPENFDVTYQTQPP